jgi:hypothetical protein
MAEFRGKDPGNRDTEFLVTVYPETRTAPAVATIAYRSSPFESWGPPFDLEEVSADAGRKDA